jgi:hypothetical protein
MFVVGNSLLGAATVLDYALSFYSWIIIARALILGESGSLESNCPISDARNGTSIGSDSATAWMEDGDRPLAADRHRGNLVFADRGRPVD